MSKKQTASEDPTRVLKQEAFAFLARFRGQEGPRHTPAASTCPLGGFRR